MTIEGSSLGLGMLDGVLLGSGLLLVDSVDDGNTFGLLAGGAEDAGI
jgi:hypothetical protein